MKQASIIFVIVVATLFILWALLSAIFTALPEETRERPRNSAAQVDVPEEREKVTGRTLSGFSDTDLSTATIPVDQILSGGPGKDGIPAIDAPTFIPLAEASLDADIEGVLVDIDGVQRFYPLTILVWHEIVNDQIGETPYSVTFCPLCGSAVTFDRRVNDQVLDFGVSGYLFESNLLMYDRQTESLWSQARGEAVDGPLVTTELNLIPMQQITFAQLQSDFPESVVMSDDTGYRRNYGVYPYGDYSETERTIFPVSVSDKRYFAKEIMYVIPIGDTSVAFPKDELVDTASREVDGKVLTVVRDGGLINAELDGVPVPGYFEMWFSWATHHQDDGLVWEL